MRYFIPLLLWTFLNITYALPPAFHLIALGVHGGVTDGNLSAYLLAPANSNQFISLDAGTLVHGLQTAIAHGAFNHIISPTPHQSLLNTILTKHISAYLISHAHFDHVVGFIIAAPILKEKQLLLTRAASMSVLLKNVFNWSIWLNSGNKGEKPQLHFQRFQILPLLQWVPLPGTALSVKAFPLNHGKHYPSTAFLIRHNNNYILYFGDTSADSIEHDNKIQAIWHKLAPLIHRRQLRAILLECSYPNSQPNDQLFGHLKPKFYLAEIQQLAQIVNTDSSNELKGLPIFITHVKPNLAALNNHASEVILHELNQGNRWRVHFILPQQGKKYDL